MQPDAATTVAHAPQRIGVPRETFSGEKRVATVPDVVAKLIKLGFSVAVESGAGDAASLSDDAYRAEGAVIVPTAAELWATSDIVFKVRPPSADEVTMVRPGMTLIGFIWPAQHPDLMAQLAAAKATVLAIDALPRTLSRAQKMDALTSMAGVSGYRAVVEAANAFGRFLQRPDHGCGQGASGQSVHSRCRCGRSGRHWHRSQPGRHRSRQRHPCRSGRPGRVAGR
jgi:NAD(P) transhydrogenase subunit alpha